MQSIAKTDLGLRNHNEDAFLMEPELGLYVVADGMGGQSSGEFASRLLVEHFQRFFGAHHSQPPQPWPFPVHPEHSPHERLIDACARLANAEIMSHGNGMGSTLAACVFDEHTVTLAHIGDSRIYRLREGMLERLTTDHSLLNDYIAAGALTTEEMIRNFPYKNVLTRTVGMIADMESPTMRSVGWREGDLFLLCTDGLSQYVEDQELGHLLTRRRGEDLCEALVERALDRGSSDNITVLLVST